MAHLGRLVLDGTNIEGQGLIHLQELQDLVELRLGCPKLSELFLGELAGLKKLENLSLAKSHVSDVGARQLAQLAHLKELDLTETNVTAAGVRELQKSLPACRILTTAAPANRTRSCRTTKLHTSEMVRILPPISRLFIRSRSPSPHSTKRMRIRHAEQCAEKRMSFRACHSGTYRSIDGVPEKLLSLWDRDGNRPWGWATPEKPDGDPGLLP